MGRAEAALTLMPARFDTTYIGVYENLNKSSTCIRRSRAASAASSPTQGSIAEAAFVRVYSEALHIRFSSPLIGNGCPT